VQNAMDFAAPGPEPLVKDAGFGGHVVDGLARKLPELFLKGMVTEMSLPRLRMDFLARHKKEPRAVHAPGASASCASACRLLRSGRRGVGGWDAARVGPTALPLISRFCLRKCDARITVNVHPPTASQTRQKQRPANLL